MSDKCIVCLESTDFVVPLATSYGTDPADKKTLAEILTFLIRPISVSIEDGFLCLNCFNSTKDAYNISILATNNISNKVVESKKVSKSDLKSNNMINCQNDGNQHKIETIEYISDDEELLTKCNDVAVHKPDISYEISDTEIEINKEKKDSSEQFLKNKNEQFLENDAREQVLENENERNLDDDIEEYEYFVMEEVDTTELQKTYCEPESATLAIQRKIKQSAKFECVTCEKKFTFRDNLRRHMKLHSTKSIFDCSMCPSKSFSTKLLLFNHLYKEHQLPAPYSCTKCNAGFTYYSQLKVHKISKSCRSPEEKGAFICEFCTRPFVIASNLKRHLMIHNNEKPFKCGYCAKSFNQKQALITHERIHSKETPIHCLKCPKKFSDPSSFKKHQQSHQPVYIYDVQ